MYKQKIGAIPHCHTLFLLSDEDEQKPILIPPHLPTKNAEPTGYTTSKHLLRDPTYLFFK